MRRWYVHAFIFVAVLSACASNTPAPGTNVVKSMDGSYTGEVIGTVSPDSKFAKLKIGMNPSEVHSLIKTPDNMQNYESGKRWIPFYFGNDAKRIMEYYAGEGCLTYTGGGPFGGGGGQLIRIAVDKTKACYE